MNEEFEKEVHSDAETTNESERKADVAHEEVSLENTTPVAEEAKEIPAASDSQSENTPHSQNAAQTGAPYPAAAPFPIHNSVGNTPQQDTYSYRWNYDDYQKQQQQQGKSKKKNGLKMFAITVASVFVLSFSVLTGVITYQFITGQSTPESLVSELTNGKVTAETTASKDADNDSVKSPSQISSTDGRVLTIPEIAAKCQPSSVGIKVSATSNYGFESNGVGSGFIYNKDGYVVTNAHVIEGASEIAVVLNDKSEVKAKLIGSDTLSDLAVLKIDGEGLVPMEIGNSDEVVVGDLAVAIGSPAGIEYTGSVTDGIISAINRDVEIYNNYGRVQKTMTLIQTNATVNRGNSGGPLINKYGQVIGINTLKLTSDFEGMGFSIPINGALDIIKQLIDKGEVSDRTGAFVSSGGSIGITQYADISKEESDYYDIPEGVFVIQLQKDCNAAKAGLRRGDIITKYNGTAVKSADEINKLKEKSKAGDEAKITVYRDGEGEINLTFKLNAMN